MARMRHRDRPQDLREGIEIIASVGQAQLVRTFDLKYELRGGTEEDRIALKKWISMFFRDVVVREI